MNTHLDHQTRYDGIVTATGLLVLVIGAATGSAMVLLVMSVLALAALNVFKFRPGSRKVWLAMALSAAIAAAAAVVLGLWK